MSSSDRSRAGANKQIKKKERTKMKTLGALAQAASRKKSTTLSVLFPIIDEYIRNKVKVPHPAWPAERTSGVHAHMPRDEIYPYRQKPAHNTRTQHTNPPHMLTQICAAPESFDTLKSDTHILDHTRREPA